MSCKVVRWHGVIFPPYNVFVHNSYFWPVGYYCPFPRFGDSIRILWDPVAMPRATISAKFLQLFWSKAFDEIYNSSPADQVTVYLHFKGHWYLYYVASNWYCQSIYVIDPVFSFKLRCYVCLCLVISQSIVNIYFTGRNSARFLPELIHWLPLAMVHNKKLKIIFVKVSDQYT